MKVTPQDVRNAFESVSSANLHVGDIPSDILTNACSGMMIRENRSDVLAVYDSCVFFRHGNEGMAVVPNGIYMRKMGGQPVFKAWNEIKSVNRDGSDIMVDGVPFFAFSGDEDNMRNGIEQLLRRAVGATQEESDTTHEESKTLSRCDHRTHMPLFCEISDAGLKNGFHCFAVGDEHNGTCIGIEIASDAGNGITVYAAPQEGNELNLLLNLGEGIFDDFVAQIDKYSAKGLSNAFPLLMEALANGANDYYAKPSLIRMPDCTQPSKKIWCLVMKLYNVDISKDLTSKYVMDGITTLLEYVNKMLEQLSSNNVSILDKSSSFAQRTWDFGKFVKLAMLAVTALSGGSTDFAENA